MMTGATYEQLRRMVQLEMYALKAMAGPRYSRPNRMLNIDAAIIALTGMLNRGLTFASLSLSLSIITTFGELQRAYH
jgi:hypothetical protein